MNIGHVEAHEKLTARLFWKLTSEAGYNDAGNVKEYADATTRSLVTRARAENGARFVNDEQVDIEHESYTFLLDERDDAQEKLLKLARALTDTSQTAGEAATALIEDIQLGRWHTIGAYNIANVTISGSESGSDLIEGADWEVDRENGRLHIFSTSVTAAAGEDITVTFDRPAITIQRFESQYTPQFYVDIIIEEHNQFHRMWLRRGAFRGFITITEFPNQTGEFGTFRAKVTPSAAVTWQKRSEGSTLSSHVETLPTEGAGLSSSSSSSTSGSASSSSSSS